MNDFSARIFGSLSTPPAGATSVACCGQADPGDETQEAIKVAVWVSDRGEKVNTTLSESERLRAAKALLAGASADTAESVWKAAQERIRAVGREEAERRYDELRAKGKVL